MDRRAFVTVLGAIVAAPLAAGAQQAAKVYRLGILSTAAVPDPSVPTTPNLVPLFLRELGYIDGQNLVVERRFAEGKYDRLHGLARELVQLRVDVIVAVGDDAILAAKDATATIPIVMGYGNNPVERGFVASLARPGSNITGVRYEGSGESQLTGKRLELIKVTIPRAARVAVLTTGESGSRAQVRDAQKVTSALGVKLIVVETQGTDYDRAFAKMVAQQAEALFVVSSTLLNRDHKQIIERVARFRLPAMYEWREQVEASGLMSYGNSTVELSRRVAAFVDKILKGARPAELPVEQPTKYGLVINLKTAKALGLTIPQSLLLRADEIIQ